MGKYRLWTEKRTEAEILRTYKETGDRTAAVRRVLDAGASWSVIDTALTRLERRRKIPRRRIRPRGLRRK